MHGLDIYPGSYHPGGGRPWGPGGKCDKCNIYIFLDLDPDPGQNPHNIFHHRRSARGMNTMTTSAVVRRRRGIRGRGVTVRKSKVAAAGVMVVCSPEA